MPYVSQRAYESMPLRTVDLNEVHGDPYADELGNGAPVYEAWALEGDRTSSVGGTDFSYEPMKLIGDVEKPSLASSSTRGIAGRHGPRHTFHTPGGRPSSNELWRFRARGCQDCWAALFFVAFVVVTLLWGAAQIWQLELTEYDLAVISGEVDMNGPMQYGSDTFPSGKTGPLRHAAALRAGMGALWERQNALLHRNQIASHPGSRLSISSALGMLIGLGLGVTTTVLIAYLGLLIISLYPRQLIFVQAVFCSVFFAISAGVALAQGSPLGALVGTVFTFMPLLWIYLIQDRIPFTATMLCATVAVLRRHKSLFVISFASVLVCWSVLVVFTLCVLPSVLRLTAGWVAGKDIVYPFVVAFVFFWVQEVLNALVHVTVCGVVATWYFAGEECMPEYPVKMSFQRAVTTSFGSVCFGSLVTAIVSFIHFLIDCVRSGNDQDSFLMCLMDCLVGCIEDLVRYFNQYAFVHVAVYGCGYVEAGKETWALVQQCVFSAVFNDCLASQVVAIMTLISAVFVAALTAIATWSAAAAMLMFVMTWVVCSIFYTPIASCVATIFVCFAEVPVGLQLSFPELYDALVDADSGYTARRGDNGGNSYGTYAI